MTEEIWKPVVGYEGLYEVSDQGRVRSVERVVRNKWKTLTVRRSRVLATFEDKDGYLRLSLWRDGAMRQRPVHQLVLEAFVGPAPSDKYMTLHGDGHRTNNIPSNLAWGTALQNAIDRARHGRGFEGVRNPKAKLTKLLVEAIRMDARASADLATAFEVSRKTICDIKSGRTWIGG